MIFFVKPSIGRSAALKTWQCASMMRLMRGADCAQADEGSTDFSAATATLPAINSRRRIAHLAHVGRQAAETVGLSRYIEAAKRQKTPMNQYAYSLNTGSTLCRQ